MAGPLMPRGTPVRLEFSADDLALIRAAAYAEGRPIWQFVTDAAVAQAKRLLQKPE